MRKHFELGRSMVEMLSVLVVIAILTLSGTLGYNFTVHKFKKDQTVKQISELIVRYKLRPIKPKGDTKVRIKDIYPEAEVLDAHTMKVPDSSEGSIEMNVSSTSAFSVVVQILDDSCEELLERGDYDAVLAKANEVDLGGSEEIALGSDYLKKNKELIKKICEGNVSGKAHLVGRTLVNGDKCARKTFTYYYEGGCHACPSGQEQDKSDVCCETGAINACGYCDGLPNGLELDKCVSGGSGKESYCNASTRECEECREGFDDCEGGKSCSKHHCCPEGQSWKNGMCDCPDGKLACGSECCDNECSTNGTTCKKECTGTSNACQICDDASGDYVADSSKNGQEVDPCTKCENGEIVAKDGTKKYLVKYDGTETCCTNDGADGSEGCATDNKCCTSGNCSNNHCCTSGEKYTLGDNQCCPSGRVYKKDAQEYCCSVFVVSGVCPNTCTPGETVGECGKCNSTGDGIEEDTSKTKYCHKCDTTTWTFVEDNTKDGTSVEECGICDNGTVTEDTSETKHCHKCNTTTWKWDIDDTNTSGLNMCQRCQSGSVEPQDTALPFLVTHDGTDKCCAKDGTAGSECSSNDCCVTDSSCTTNGHCCPTGQDYTLGDNQCCDPEKIYEKDGKKYCCPKALLFGTCPSEYKEDQVVGCCIFKGGKFEVDSTQTVPECKKCATATCEWVPDSTKDGTVISTDTNNCGRCKADGTIEESTSGNICQTCSGESGTPKWQLYFTDPKLTHEVAHDAVLTCCANDGSKDSVCQANNCCATGLECIAEKCSCPTTKPLWNGTACVSCPSGAGIGTDYTGANTGSTTCKCHKDTPVWSGTACEALSCSVTDAGIADTTTYTGADAGKANDGVTTCKCHKDKPVLNSTACISCPSGAGIGTDYTGANAGSTTCKCHKNMPVWNGTACVSCNSATYVENGVTKCCSNLPTYNGSGTEISFTNTSKCTYTISYSANAAFCQNRYNGGSWSSLKTGGSGTAQVSSNSTYTARCAFCMGVGWGCFWINTSYTASPQ